MRFPILAALILCPAVASAQFDISLLGGYTKHSSQARNLEPDADGLSSLRLADVTGLSLGLGFQRGAWRASALIGQTSPGLELRSTGGDGVIVGELITNQSVMLSIGRRILGGPESSAISLLAGVSLQRWQQGGLVADDTRIIVTPQASIEAAIPIGGSFSGVARAGTSRSKSIWEESELPEAFIPETAWRTELQVGLRWSM